MYLGEDHLGVYVLNQVGLHFLRGRDKKKIKVSMTIDKMPSHTGWIIDLCPRLHVCKKESTSYSNRGVFGGRLALSRKNGYTSPVRRL